MLHTGTCNLICTDLLINADSQPKTYFLVDVTYFIRFIDYHKNRKQIIYFL